MGSRQHLWLNPANRIDKTSQLNRVVESSLDPDLPLP